MSTHDPDPKPWPAGSIPTAAQLLDWLQLEVRGDRSPAYDQRIGTLERILGSAELGVRCMTDQHEHRLAGLRENNRALCRRIDEAITVLAARDDVEQSEQRLRAVPDDQVTVGLTPPSESAPAKGHVAKHVHRWLAEDPDEVCLVYGCGSTKVGRAGSAAARHAANRRGSRGV